MASLKTKPTSKSVQDFLAGLGGQKAKDSLVLCELMQNITGEPPMMWGPSIIGFGTYHYTYKSGRHGDWMLTGFSPRKAALTIYVIDGFDHYQELLEKLGAHTTSKGCLYVKQLGDINLDVLGELLRRSIKNITSGDFLL